jgi:hypothetical protein
MAEIGAAPVFKMTRQVPPLNLGSYATGGHKRPLQPIDLVRQGDLGLWLGTQIAKVVIIVKCSHPDTSVKLPLGGSGAYRRNGKCR